MFSTSFSSALFGLLIIMQTLIAVSSLPTSTTTTMSICAQLGTRQASDINRGNNSNNHGSGYNNVAPPNNNTTSLERLAIWGMLSQFDKRDTSENNELNGNDLSPGEKLATVIASLTLLVATIPLLRCSRFRHWMSSSISPPAKVYPLLLSPHPLHICPHIHP
ncbi:hypothetical protein B9Z19DRAFT_1085643 [Tuber borchii]|uniref:Uncharacterized protein n=1 Tax=Tuber borchii TaxID=42251 RepID=A0A2T6ZQI1_TUBBO|nr:hypothetical protein B9Z19DRAFT_1085643 [Tuber borchii]